MLLCRAAFVRKITIRYRFKLFKNSILHVRAKPQQSFFRRVKPAFQIRPNLRSTGSISIVNSGRILNFLLFTKCELTVHNPCKPPQRCVAGFFQINNAHLCISMASFFRLLQIFSSSAITLIKRRKNTRSIKLYTTWPAQTTQQPAA